MENVCAVTVTYGDRYERLASSTISRALASGASRIVVVNNGSNGASRNAMELEFGRDDKVIFVHLGANLGSAVGFAQGINRAAAEQTKFIWLLDDDNWVEQDTLEQLLVTRSSAAVHYGDSLVSVCGYRCIDNYHVRIAEGRPASTVFPPIGAFLAFDMIHYIRRHLPVRGDLDIDDLCLPSAPYGGLLFPTDLVKMVGLPPAEYILYVDDTVWTSRIVASGHKIVLDRAASIHDADAKWSGKSGGGPRGMLASADERRLYYSVRNRVHYDLSRIKNPAQMLRYQLNKMVFMTIASSYGIGHYKTSFQVLRNGVRDGGRFTLSASEVSSH